MPPAPLTSPEYPFHMLMADYFDIKGKTWLVAADRFSGVLNLCPVWICPDDFMPPYFMPRVDMPPWILCLHSFLPPIIYASMNICPVFITMYFMPP